MNDLISQSIQTSRTLTGELSPPILLESGLIAALEWLVRSMQEKYGLAVDLKTEGQAIPSSQELAVLLFQAVRELLFNVVKHAQVKEASVQIRRLDRHLQIMIQDKGIGFDPARLGTLDGSPEGFGLFHIRNRLDVLGGMMEILSAPGQGSRITLMAPLGAPTVQPGADGR